MNGIKLFNICRLPGNTGEALRMGLVWVIGLASCAAPSTARSATYGQEAVAAVLLAEARGEGLAGMRAVAEVIRCRADLQGTSMLAVLKPGTFSSLNGTSIPALIRRFSRHPLYAQALQIAKTAYNQPHQLGNQTRGATHFTQKSEKPHWSKGLFPVATIGQHAFYRL
jgi:spore germination cell wall hydrolase CwlJ-like protein